VFLPLGLRTGCQLYVSVVGGAREQKQVQPSGCLMPDKELRAFKSLRHKPPWDWDLKCISFSFVIVVNHGMLVIALINCFMALFWFISHSLARSLTHEMLGVPCLCPCPCLEEVTNIFVLSNYCFL